MRILTLFVFTWVSIFAPTYALGQDQAPELAPWVEMASDANLKLRLFTTLSRTEQKLQSKLGQWQSKQLPENEFLDGWTSDFKKITNDYVQAQMKNYNWDTRDISAVKKKMEKLNWRELGKIFVSQLKHLKPFLRLNGPGIFSALVLTNVLQWIFPFVLASLGHNPMWAAILLKIPTSLPVIYSYQLVSAQFYKLRLIKDLGGVKAYKDFEKINQASLDNLDLKQLQDHILPLDSSGAALRLPRANPLTQIAQMFGLKKEELTLNSLKDFLEKHGINDPLVNGFINDEHLARQDRLAMALMHLYNNLGPKTRSAFRLRFSEHFIQIRALPQSWSSTTSWVDKVLMTNSTQDLFEELENMPEQMRAQELIDLWDEIILPELAKSDQLEYSQIRRAIKRFHALKIQNAKSENIKISSDFHQSFLNYVREALTNSKRDCFNTHNQVLQKLMNF